MPQPNAFLRRAGSPPPQKGASFADTLGQVLENVGQSGRNAEQQTAAVMQGKADMVDVVTAVAESEIGPGNPGRGPRQGDRRLRGNHADAGMMSSEAFSPMTGAEVLDVARDGIFTFLKVASPLMLIALAVGVVISLLPGAHPDPGADPGFSFPRSLRSALGMILFLPFMGDALTAYMMRIAARIASGV